MNSLGKNFLYNLTYQLLLLLLPLVTTPYISRVLGAGNVGIYTYTYTVANYFMLFAMLGVKNYGNRSIAAVRDDPERLRKTFWEIYGLQLICSAVVLAVYFGFVALFEAENRLIFLLQGLYVISGVLDISWLFTGLENFKITVSRSIVIKLLSLAAIFLFVRSADDLPIYTLIMALSTLLSQSYLWFYLRRYVKRFRPTLAGMFGHLRAELVLFVPVIAVSLYKMMDKIMLKQMSSYEQVGFYEGSDRILGIPLGVITALGTVMLPRMSNLAAKANTEKSMRYIRNSLSFAMFLAVGMMFGISAIADDFVPLFLGDEYMPTAALLQVMAPTVLFIAWANVIRTQYLIPNQRDRSYIISVLLGAVVNIAVNLLLIPRMEAMGAVIGTVCAEAAVCISQTVMVRRQLDIRRYLIDTLPFLLPGAVMFLLIGAVRTLFANSVSVIAVGAEILIGGAVYVLLAGLYAAFVYRERVKALLQKIRSRR